MTNNANDCNPKQPDCLNPKGLSQLGVNPASQKPTASENAFEHRFEDLGLKDQNGLIGGGGIHKLQQLVKKCPKSLRHIHFYRRNNDYSSHGLKKNQAVQIKSLMEQEGFEMELDNHKLGGVSLRGQKKQSGGKQKLSRKKLGLKTRNIKKGGGGFNLDLEKRIGGQAEVASYQCHSDKSPEMKPMDHDNSLEVELAKPIMGGGKKTIRRKQQQSKQQQQGGNGVKFDLKADRIAGLPVVKGYSNCNVTNCGMSNDNKDTHTEIELEVASPVPQIAGGRISKQNRQNNQNRQKQQKQNKTSEKHRNIVINTKKLSKRKQAKIIVQKKNKN